MKIAFATCVQLGLSCIQEVIGIGGEFDLFITLQDDIQRKKSGRIYLDDVAAEQEVPLLKIKNINEEIVVDTLKEKGIDWLFIIGWSQIAREEVLSAPKLGCIGMHPTLLPKGRGRASIPWAILKEEPQTGVTLFKLDSGVDTGEIIGQEVIELSESTNATWLYEQVNQAHTALISKYWEPIINNTINFKKQNEGEATLWPGRKPEDGEITSDMTMKEAEKLVRAVTKPYPGAFYNFPEKTIRIWSAKMSETDGDIKLKDGYLVASDYEIEG